MIEKILKYFKDDPSLYNKNLVEIAEYFYKRGEHSERHLRDTARNRAEHYRKYIGESVSFEALKELDETWEKASS